MTSESRWNALLDDLHSSPLKVSLVVAGGGSGAIGHCFRRAGASKTFVEAVIPYSRAAMSEYLGEAEAATVSAPTAERLAHRALQRACRLCDPEDACCQYVGISLTAALPSNSPRRGHDRIHVAGESESGRIRWTVELGDERFDRSFAETVSDELLFKALATYAPGHGNDEFFSQAGLSIQS